MSLLKYILRRLIVMIPVLFGVLTLVFILSRLMPGDPVLAYLPDGKPDPEVYAAMVHELGFDLPIYIQYFRYLGDLFVGNWGRSVSIIRGMDVWDLIMQRLPRTIDIAIFSMLIAGFLGIKTGVISAVHRNKPKDTILRGLALVGVAIPVFFMGMILQFILGYKLPIFPTTGFKDYSLGNPAYVTGFRIIDAFLSGEFYMISDYLYHLVLPVACLSFIILAGITRQSRSSMLEVLEQDYVRTARAKGCKEKDVINTHARKNSLIPTITVIGLSFAGLLSGAVLTETTFGLVGVGELLIDSIRNVDYYVLNALVFIITIMFVSINLVTDVIYAMLDPRIVY
jgi:ABC-type dipeptide/oligopeptide/nickel transport system permease component